MPRTVFLLDAASFLVLCWISGSVLALLVVGVLFCSCFWPHNFVLHRPFCTLVENKNDYLFFLLDFILRLLFLFLTSWLGAVKFFRPLFFAFPIIPPHHCPFTPVMPGYWVDLFEDDYLF
jgi:hypothetical protein